MARVSGDLRNVQGYTTLMRRLKTLSDPKTSIKNGRKASRKAMTPTFKEVRRKLRAIDRPETPTQKIWRNVALRNKRSSKGSVGARVGIRGGAKQFQGKGLSGGDTFYWRFLELGTRHIRPRSYLRSTFDSNVRQIQETFVAEFSELTRQSIAK